jgi:hypothetical protein
MYYTVERLKLRLKGKLHEAELENHGPANPDQADPHSV